MDLSSSNLDPHVLARRVLALEDIVAQLHAEVHALRQQVDASNFVPPLEDPRQPTTTSTVIAPVLPTPSPPSTVDELTVPPAKAKKKRPSNKEKEKAAAEAAAATAPALSLNLSVPPAPQPIEDAPSLPYRVPVLPPMPATPSAAGASSSTISVDPSPYRSAAGLISDVEAMQRDVEPKPFGLFFERAESTDKAKEDQQMGEKQASKATGKRKRAEPRSTPGNASAAATAASSSAASSSMAASSTTAAPSSSSSSSSYDAPVAGRYNDPSLIDVADANRDVDLLSAADAPGAYRGLLELEGELKELETQRERGRLHPLLAGNSSFASGSDEQQRASKRSRVSFIQDVSQANNHTGAAGASDATGNHIMSLLASEREAVQHSQVHDMKFDANTGKLLVLVGEEAPPGAVSSSSYTFPAKWTHVSGLDGLTPTMIPRPLIKRLKLHQLQAVKFLLDNLTGRATPVGRASALDEQQPTGCILADAMGLGKTLTVLAAVQLWAQSVRDQQANNNPFFKPCTLLVGPPTVLKHWQQEAQTLRSWLEEEDLIENFQTGTIQSRWKSMLHPVRILDASVPIGERATVLREWREQKGMLLIGYDMLRDIAHGGGSSSRDRDRDHEAIVVDSDYEDDTSASAQAQAHEEKDDAMSDVSSDSHTHPHQQKDLLSYFQDPGPDILLLDEAHKIRNLYSGVHQALTTRISTPRCILLSGYPVQNNLCELFSMIEFVRPAHLPQGHNLGSYRDFQKFFEQPIVKGQCSQDASERRKARRRCWMLFDWMKREGVMLRRSNAILVKQLPCPLYEIIFTLRFSKVQHRVYTALLEWHSQHRDLRVLDLVQFVSMLLCHPQVVRKHCHDLPALYASASEKAALITADADAMVDVEGGSSAAVAPPAPAASSTVSYSAAALFKKTFIDEVLPTATPFDLLAAHSAKMVLMMQIILESKRLGEKVLVFSKWIHTLDFVENLLDGHNAAFEAQLSNEEDKLLRANEKVRYGRFDGSTPQADRQMWIGMFGPPSVAKEYQHAAIPDVLLISTLCGEGINLCRASRVILLDVSWNPNHDHQAAHRVYRYGQSKPCFVYRFVVANSMEEKMLLKQIRKEELSKWSIERRHVARNTAAAQTNDVPETFAPQSAKEAAQAADPTNIRRFFDPPPAMADLLAAKTEIHLSQAIQQDRVTKHLLQNFCNPPSSSAVAISTGPADEPNTWILSAFEQHTMLEDDSSTSALFGEEVSGGDVRTAASTAPPADEPMMVSSPVLPPSTNAAATPTAQPKYWFGQMPPGLTLANTHSTSTGNKTEPPSAASASSKSLSSSVPSMQPETTAKSVLPDTSRLVAAATSASPTPSATTSTSGRTVSGSSNRVPIPYRFGSSPTNGAPVISSATATMGSKKVASSGPPSVASVASPAVTPTTVPSALERELALRKDKLALISDARKQRKDTEQFLREQSEEQARKKAESELYQQRIEAEAREAARRRKQAEAARREHAQKNPTHFRTPYPQPPPPTNPSYRSSSRDHHRDDRKESSYSSSRDRQRERDMGRERNRR